MREPLADAALVPQQGIPPHSPAPITPKSRLRSTSKSGSAASWPVKKRNPTIKLKTAAKMPKTRYGAPGARRDEAKRGEGCDQGVGHEQPKSKKRSNAVPVA